MKIAERIIRGFLEGVGIAINGPEPWDITVHDDRFYWRVLSQGSLGLGESYMDGWWDCPHLDQFFTRLLKNGLPWGERLTPPSVLMWLKSKLINFGTPKRAIQIGKDHYDLGNSLYTAMLGRTMAYTCAYYAGLPRNADNLDAAQFAKFELVCRKLYLQPGQSVWDPGCGFGGLAHYAATKNRVRVVGFTVSKQQAILAREKCRGLQVDIRVKDYRDIDEQFDRIASVGMLEHVGPKNYRTYMRLVKKSLKPGGLLLLHTIGMSPEFNHPVDAWIMKRIFPGAQVPTKKQILNSAQKEGLELRDWHRFRRDYDPTLMAWYDFFEAAWPRLEAEYGHLFEGKFHRGFSYYLLSCAALFRLDLTQLWQGVFAHPGEHRDYVPVR